MSLPAELAGIFTHKQKSYKMVLIIALLQEMSQTNQREVSLENVRARFLAFLQERERLGEPVDSPINNSPRWADVTMTHITQIIYSPISALNSILDVNPQEQSIGFKERLYNTWNQEVFIELYDHATHELAQYHQQRHSSDFTIRDALLNVLTKYTAAKREPLKNNSLGQYVRHQIPTGIREYSFIKGDSNLKVQASVGMGTWARIPWIAIMDRRITETTQQGEYIVYLFSEDMNSVYLTLMQGVTEPNKKGKAEAHKYLRNKVQEIRAMIPLEGLQKDEEINLTSDGLGFDYQVSTVAYYKYDRDDLPTEEQLSADLENLVDNYKQYVHLVLQSNDGQEQSSVPTTQPPMPNLSVSERLDAVKAYIRQRGFSFPDQLIENFYLSLKTKPFVILAGVSGTGKTKLVQLFAEAIGATSENGQYILIPVRPDWSDPSDLIGYKDLSDRFRPGPLTDVLVEASDPANRDKPYFICLDEMNLARVEHYFSDMLSILETQKRQEDRIVTDPLIRPSALVNEEDRFKYGRLHIPDNVYLIGTVNMDETTHPFSKKVLDRANTIEFNEIKLDVYPSPSANSVPTLPAPNAFLRADYLQLVDAYQGSNIPLIEKVTSELVRINDILEQIHSHVGFRIRDANCFYLLYNEQAGLLTNDEALDYQLLQKILPRIQGSNRSVKRVLLQLLEIALSKKLNKGELEDDASELWSNLAKTVESAKYPQSANKIVFMLRRLDEDGFTSYWLS
ncbi:MrcB family domain-containing protein [Cohnella sp.]|uniref:MrcB family domain-containing protein n=1 Tax=Cohnella sp. TaxID=1883426 RepID=UPI0035659909